MRPLKVFACSGDGRNRCIVAAKTLTEAARLMGIPYHRIKGWGGETGNKQEITLAMSEPGVVWHRGTSAPFDSPFTKGKP